MMVVIILIVGMLMIDDVWCRYLLMHCSQTKMLDLLDPSVVTAPLV